MGQVKQTSTKFENKHGIERALTRNFRIRSQNKNMGTFFVCLIFLGFVFFKLRIHPGPRLGWVRAPALGLTRALSFSLSRGLVHLC